MKRLELLIDMARQLSQNTRYDSDSGVPQKVFVQYFQKAQDALYKGIVLAKTKYFIKSELVPVVNGQELYSYPQDLFLNNIDTVEWSDDGDNYFFLDKGISKDRMSAQIGYPFSYIPTGEGYLLSPPIDAGTLRISYIPKKNNLQIRQGKITAVTINGSNQITALTVNPAEASFDSTAVNEQNYLCVVDRDGVQTAKNIEYDSMNGSGVFTLSAQTLGDGETISVGDYICVGQNVVNQPEFPDICESFLIDFANYAAKYGDSSQWTKEAKEDMAQNLNSLLESFKTSTDDIDQIPITDATYLDMR